NHGLRREWPDFDDSALIGARGKVQGNVVRTGASDKRLALHRLVDGLQDLRRRAERRAQFRRLELLLRRLNAPCKVLRLSEEAFGIGALKRINALLGIADGEDGSIAFARAGSGEEFVL